MSFILVHTCSILINVAVAPVPAKKGEDDGYRKATSGGQEKVRRRGGG